jgi:hypothetical protein
MNLPHLPVLTVHDETDRPDGQLLQTDPEKPGPGRHRICAGMNTHGKG